MRYVYLSFVVLISLLGFYSCGGEGETTTEDVSGPKTVKLVLTISPNSNIPADGKSSAKITVKLTIGGENAEDETEISLIATGKGKFSNKSNNIVLYTSNGQATETLTSEEEGTVTVTAVYQDPSTNKEYKKSASVAFVKVPVETGEPCLIILTAKDREVIANGEDFVEIEAIATDFEGKPVASGTQIVFTATSPGSFQGNVETPVTNISVLTNAQGIAKVRLYALTYANTDIQVNASFKCKDAQGNEITSSTKEPLLISMKEPIKTPTLKVTSEYEYLIANGIDSLKIEAIVTSDGVNPVTNEVDVIFDTVLGYFVASDNSKPKNIIVKTQGGKASAQLKSDGDMGIARVNIQTKVSDKQLSKSIDIRLIRNATISCNYIGDKHLGLKNSGHKDFTSMCFKVVDDQGAPISKITLNFAPSDAPGGIYVNPTSMVSDDSGLACTVLYAGTVPTTVWVKGSSKVGEARCGPVVMTTGVPNAKYLNFSCSPTDINVQGFVYDLLEQNCAVAIADRFSNKIPFATKIFFRTEAGAITPSAETSEEGDKIGIATVTLRTQDPRPKDVPPLTDEPRVGTGLARNPRDGLVTIIAATTGEEEFDDENGNGQYDLGEAFVDLGEPFVDMNDNNQWDSDEAFIDVNLNGNYDGPNGKWDGNTVIWKPTWVVWTGNIATGGKCLGATPDPNSASVICPERFDIPNKGSMPFYYSFKDFNLLPPIPGSMIEVKVDGAGKLLGDTSKTVPAMTGISIFKVRKANQTNPKISYEVNEFKFGTGYSGGFTLADEDPEKEVMKPSYVSVTIETKTSTGSEKTVISSSGRMDSTISSGACRSKLSFTPSLPVAADGVSQVLIKAEPLDKDGLPWDTTITFSTDIGKFTAGGSKYLVVNSSNKQATVQMVNGERGGTATVQASFICNDSYGTKVTDEVKITFIGVNIVVEPESGKTSIMADGIDSVKFNATLIDDSGMPVADGALVKFATNLGYFKNPPDIGSPNGYKCVNTKINTTNICVTQTSGGVATVDMVGGYSTGEATVSASLFQSNPELKSEVKVNVVQLADIKFLSVSKSPLGVKDSGYNESAEVIFRVVDTAGRPLSGQNVDFTFTGAQSGSSAITLNPTSSVSAEDGLVKTIIRTGTLAQTVNVLARAQMGTQIVTASSEPIVIIGAKPNRKYVTLSCEHKNLGGFGSEKVGTNCVASARDRYTNIVKMPVAVRFMAEAGIITNVSNITEEGNAYAAYITNNVRKPADVAPISKEPSYVSGGKTYNPRDGLVTIIAAFKGEEEFDDINGNGKYDNGEPFVDQGEPFVDENDNGYCDGSTAADEALRQQNKPYNCAELYIDTNNDAKYTPSNGVWDAHSDPNDNSLVWVKTYILWSGPVAIGSTCSQNSPNLSVICPTNFNLADGSSQDFTYEIKDERLNPITKSSIITLFTLGKIGIDGKPPVLKDDLGMKISVSRSCQSFVCSEQTSITDFSSGIKGVFAVFDDVAGDSGQTQNVSANVKVTYSFDPSADEKNYDQSATITSLGIMNDPNATGPCAFRLEASSTVIQANGTDSTLISVKDMRDQFNQPIGPNVPVQIKTTLGKFSNGEQEIVVLTNNNSEATVTMFGGSQAGAAEVSAQYFCGNKAPLRKITVIIRPADALTKYFISVVASDLSLIADGDSRTTITAFVFDNTNAPVKSGSVKITTTDGTLECIDPPPTCVYNDIQHKDVTAQLNNSGNASVKLISGPVAALARVEGKFTTPDNKIISNSTYVSFVTLGSIMYQFITTDVMGAKGSGFNETAIIGFKVFDNIGQRFPKNQRVDFTLSNAPGGLIIIPPYAYTDDSGMVYATVKAGTVATTFTVTATSSLPGVTVRGVSPAIAVIGAKPSARYMNFTCEKKVVATLGSSPKEIPCTVSLGDRYTNKVEKATTVHFRTEAGLMTSQALTYDRATAQAKYPNDWESYLGTAEARLRTSEPYPYDVAPISGEPYNGTYNPRDTIVSIISVTTGEEEFYDNDGNGEFTGSEMWRESIFQGQPQKFDPGIDKKCRRIDIASYDPPVCNNWLNTVGGDTISVSEPFIDLAEPFFDADDDNTKNLPIEQFFDTNGDGIWNAGNNRWDSNTNIYKETIMAWSDSVDQVANPFPSTGQCSGNVPVTPGINLICPNTAFTMGNGQTMRFNFKVCDSHFVNQAGAILKFETAKPISDKVPPPPVISGPSEFVIPEKPPYKLVFTYSSPTQVTVCQTDPNDSNYRICYINTVVKLNKTLQLFSDYCYSDYVTLQAPLLDQGTGTIQTFLKATISDKVLWYITGTVTY
ncbi:MAG: hypothetical protein N2746_10685 [Deltaproteobacteria bacterium]|nr:hypothetical protein [Deltaproteobacteria bacterium]